MTTAIRRPAVFRRIGVRSAIHDTVRKPRFLFTLDPVGVGRNELCPALAARAASPEGLLARRRIDPADDRALEMVAYGDGQPVRRVEMRRQFGHMEHAFEQGSYLFPVSYTHLTLPTKA